MPSFGDVKINALNRQLIIEWQDKLWQTKNAKTNKYLSYKYLVKIRDSFFNLLKWTEERFPVSFGINGIRKPKRIENAQKLANYWTKEEFDRFLSCVSQQKYKTFFSILFYTGRRKGEILALTPSDIKGDYITINKTYTRKTVNGEIFLITANKNTKTGVSFIPEDLRKEIEKYTPNEPFYFGGQKPISEHALQNAFDRAVELSGVKRIRIHDLRHSFASRLIHLGASAYLVADCLGDNVEQVYKTYGHLYETDKERILKLL